MHPTLKSNAGEWSQPIVNLFYSNFSGNCKALLQYIDNAGITDHIPIKFINVDNPTMRSVVSAKISHVPALVVLQDDQMSLYVAESVWEWFDNYRTPPPLADGATVDSQASENGEKEAQPTPPKEGLLTVLELAKQMRKEREQQT
ncbi:hypothetical protein MIV030L [Invertebrate iridescent virus 3]|uniref:uncharacterized protein 030L n=1 Tax=Invertebrate iridescent virus 3 TaxID=345201 RepID=030L_IIV3|nr:hypothetical protein MIV030L [Invertebrate iridescent virus 3]Q197D0.1 RecName: Full=uncharacterized protein 030L [Invertebrate iridescent virus 3]ABF82060.1 hypothetical protein MIV030L [Invertebrate iridescent virus 3]